MPRVNLFNNEFEHHFLALLKKFINISIVCNDCSRESARVLLAEHTKLALAMQLGVAMHVGKTVTVGKILGLSEFSDKVSGVPALDCPLLPSEYYA